LVLITRSIGRLQKFFGSGLPVSVGLMSAPVRAAELIPMAISRTGVRACAGSRIRCQSVMNKFPDFRFFDFLESVGGFLYPVQGRL